MKRINLFSTLGLMLGLAAMLQFAACGSAENPSTSTEGPGVAKIHGTVTNPSGEEVSFRMGEEKFTAALEEGVFDMEIELAESGYGTMKIGQEFAYLYVHPGDDMELTIDLDAFDETIAFKGRGAKPNNYLASKLLEDEKRSTEENPYMMDEAAFVAWSGSEKEFASSYLEDFFAEAKEPCTEFIEAQTAKNEMEWATQRLNYPSYHAYYSGDKDFEASENYMDFVQDMDFDKEGMLDVPGFEALSLSLVRALAETEEGMTQSEEWLATLDVVDEQFQTASIRNFLYTQNLEDYLNYNGVEGFEPLYERFKANCDDEDCKAKIAGLHEQWSKLAQGEAAPVFAYESISGEKVALDDLRGKVVYIDVWATWCGPCRKEIPHLDEMQVALADRDDIVFASVSVDEDKEAWEEMVAEKELKGLQLYAEGAFSSQICTDYIINGIPRFIAIDKEGNIASANAPRPSSGEVEDMLIELAES